MLELPPSLQNPYIRWTNIIPVRATAGPPVTPLTPEQIRRATPKGRLAPSLRMVSSRHFRGPRQIYAGKEFK